MRTEYQIKKSKSVHVPDYAKFVGDKIEKQKLDV